MSVKLDDVNFNFTVVHSFLQSLNNTLPLIQYDVDNWWTQGNGVYVFMMQCGFAFLEAGCIETKNVTNILMKNFIDVVLGGIIWYLWGFGFAFGGYNSFVGTSYFCLTGIPEGQEGVVRTSWWFQFTFAAASTTILSGSLAARGRFEPYMIWSMFYIGWVYAAVAHWTWTSVGWLSATNPNVAVPFGVVDWAGGSVVHICGGTVSLVAAAICGPRLGRFDPEWDGDKPGTLRTFRSLWSGLGTFLLWFGWYGFNPGSSLGAINKSQLNSLAAINTTIAPCAGAISALLCQFIARGNWDIGKTCNGLLSGLVAITPACTSVQPWAALIIGALGGILYYFVSLFLLYLKIDDPVDATPVHCTNGVWGMLAIGLFADKELLMRAYGHNEYWGAFMGGGGMMLGVQLLASFVVIVWAVAWSFPFFYIINHIGYLRVHKDIEKLGLDMEHVEMSDHQKTILAKKKWEPYNLKKDSQHSNSGEEAPVADKDLDLEKLQ